MKCSEIMICTKCGSEYKDSYRACIKCGALNEEHPLNKDLIKYTSKIKKTKIRNSKNDFNNIFKEEKRINMILFIIVNLLVNGALIFLAIQWE